MALLAAMAVSTAAWKILAFALLAAACCCAVLKTFSNTRGTASRNVGWNSGSAWARVLVSGQCPRIGAGLQAADLDDPGERVRERQEQQGRAPGDLEDLERARPATALRTSDSRLRWVSSQPFGRPVVPEV